MGRRNLVSEFMDEDIVYGGCLATRYTVYRDMVAQRAPKRWADLMAFGHDPATPEQKASLPRFVDVLEDWEAEGGEAT